MNLFWGGQTKFSNRKLRARPKSRAQTPETRGRSLSRRLKAPENFRRSLNRGQRSRNKRGRGLGRGLGEPLPRNFLKNQT